MLLAALTVVGAASCPAHATEAAASSQQECRRIPSRNGAFIGRKICKPAREWARYDRENGLDKNARPVSNSVVGDHEGRTMTRPMTVR